MAVFAVFKENVSYKYKSTLFSKASAVLLICTALQLIIPLFVSYRTGEFWFKTSSFQEQPQVNFKHEYILLIETDRVLRSLVCGTGVGYDDLRSHCLFKYIEVDSNHDGRPDILRYIVTVPLNTQENVRAITLALLMDLCLNDLCVLRTDSVVLTHQSTCLPASKLSIVSDMRLLQSKPLGYRCIDDFRRSLELDGETDFQDMVQHTSACNVSLELRNEKIFWTYGRADDEPFTMSLEIAIPESSILYKPGVMQLLKWAWIQYFSLFVVFSHVVYLIKKFVYCNNLVWTYKIAPWKVF